MKTPTGPGSCVHWTHDEVARLDALIRLRSLVHSDVVHFPGRTADAMHRKAAKRRLQLRLPAFLGTGPRNDTPGEPLERPGADDPIRWAAASDQLHRATVRMCIRRGITLPGISADRTMVIAAQLGLAA
jgi:hypothetical protein